MKEFSRTHAAKGGIPLSDHYDGSRFFSPGAKTDKGWRELWRWRRTREPAPWPAHIAVPSMPPPPAVVDSEDIAITHIGHATILIQTAGCNIITDPVYSEHVGPLPRLGPRRVRAPSVSLDDLPRIDLVLLSHNHYDHMDLWTLRQLQRRWHPTVVTGLCNRHYLAGHDRHQVVELDWWQSFKATNAVTVTYVPAQHWSHRWPMDSRKALWGGHVVHAPRGNIYFAGDTGYPGYFKLIRERLGPPDVALLPIGAYEPRWFMGPQHMNPDDALRAHLDLGAQLSIAMHWGVFQLTDEAIDAPLSALADAQRTHGVDAEAFRVLDFGERFHLGGDAVEPAE